MKIENKLIRKILNEAHNRNIIGLGTLLVGVRALNNRINKVVGKEEDWTNEIKLIELVEEVLEWEK